MKKMIALLLVLVMALGLVACGNNGNTAATTTEAVQGPASALEILETVWASYAEDEKFPTMGGDFENIVDNAPGAYNLADEGLSTTLLVPADQVANIDEAASLVHGMMLNNFTCGAFHVTGDVKAFADAMNTAISTNRWMCGMPEKMFVAVIGEYVVAAFGLNDVLTNFESKLTAAYPTVEYAYNAAIVG
ncbi:MAG: hypothetical protein IKJ94_03750 [Oscillospiraceae bacterium]|nr:hypothetical protein [Oscillospiraceae bacterium]